MTTTTDNPQERGLWTSASGALRDRLCPGSHIASRDLPELPREDAEKGAAVHAWLHWRRLRMETDLPEPVCDYELAGRCWDMECKAIGAWLASIEGRINAEELANMVTYSEKRFWLVLHLKEVVIKHSGQADCALVCGQHALILDSKSGWLEAVPPQSNEQLRDLSVLIGTEHPVLESVTVQIVQPFAEPNPPAVYDRHDLNVAHLQLVDRIKQSNDPFAPRTPHPEACRFCKAKGTNRCPETQNAVMKLSETQQSLIANPTKELIQAAKLAKVIAEQILEVARTLLEKDPNCIPGVTLKPNPSNRPVTNPQELWARCAAHGMTLAQFMSCVTVGKGAIEDTLKEIIRKRTGQKIVKGWGLTLTDLMDGVTTEEPKRPSVALKD